MNITIDTIEKLKAEDRATQNEVYKGLYPPMFLLCKRFLGDHHEAEEAVQDGFYTLFTKTGSFKGQTGAELMEWLRTTMINVCKMKLRTGNWRWVSGAWRSIWTGWRSRRKLLGAAG